MWCFCIVVMWQTHVLLIWLQQQCHCWLLCLGVQLWWHEMSVEAHTSINDWWGAIIAMATEKWNVFVVLCLYLITSEFQTECLAGRKCEHWHENHWLRPLWTRETYSDADDQWCYVTYIIESSLNTHTLLQPVMIYPLLVVTMLSYL